VGQGAQLARGEDAVGNGDAQHGRVLLDVQAVLQAQHAEIVFAQLSIEEAARLVGELRHALVYQALVDGVVQVHGDCRRVMVRREEPITLTAGLVGRLSIFGNKDEARGCEKVHGVGFKSGSLFLMEIRNQ
jgi:hypothetical protein